MKYGLLVLLLGTAACSSEEKKAAPEAGAEGQDIMRAIPTALPSQDEVTEECRRIASEALSAAQESGTHVMELAPGEVVVRKVKCKALGSRRAECSFESGFAHTQNLFEEPDEVSLRYVNWESTTGLFEYQLSPSGWKLVRGCA